MHYVYILESAIEPRHHYVGRTADLRTRLAAHNAGKSPHTAQNRPWISCAITPSPTNRVPSHSKLT